MKPDLMSLFLAHTYTLNDALRRIRILRQVLQKKFFNSQVVSSDFVEASDSAWLGGLGDDFYGYFSNNNFGAVLSQIADGLKSCPTLVLYIPFDMPPSHTPYVGEYLRKTYGKNFLMNIKLDPNLIGGCALVYNGIYKDYSLRQRIKDNQETILKDLRQSLKR